MIDFRSLDRETRTVALVGRFLQLWASLETAIGYAIGTVLGVSSLQQFVLTRNTSFTNKTYMLGAFCSVSSLTDADKEEIKSILNEIRQFYKNRNIIAHEFFVDSKDTDGVEFLVMRARGKIDFPEEIWSIEIFEEHYHSIMTYSFRVNEINNKLENIGRLPLAALAAISLAPYEPTEVTPGLGSLGLHILQPPADQPLDKTSANPEIEPGIPPSPEK
jgi:hypothetical protein